MSYKQQVRTVLADTLDGIDTIEVNWIKLKSLIAVRELLTEFTQDVSLSIGELIALDEINKQNQGQ